VRLELRGQPNGFFAVAAFANNLDGRVVFEETPEATPDKGVVVNQKDSDLVGHSLACPRRLKPAFYGIGSERGSVSLRDLGQWYLQSDQSPSA